MNRLHLATVLAGALACAAISFASVTSRGPDFVASLQAQAQAARDAADGRGIEITFATGDGSLTRHPRLSGGKRLDPHKRSQVAMAIAAVPGVGGVSWRGRGSDAGEGEERVQPGSLHCQDDVEAILAARSIRFSEASAEIDPASQAVLNEVATALLPCLGSIIAITGHTDSNGDQNANIALSRARAEAVRWALIGRGIPADGLRAAGLGSEKPIEGLDPADAANRRIEFSVIEKMPIKPTPIDTPGPG